MAEQKTKKSTVKKVVEKVKKVVKKKTTKKTKKKKAYAVKKTDAGFQASIDGRTPRTFKTKEMAQRYADKRKNLK